MPIKNYTTKISAVRTVSEIQAILAEHGARKVMMEYGETGRPEGVSFAIQTGMGTHAYMLPADVAGVAAALAQQKVKCDYDQAERVAWRIVKDWIEAQMAFLESGQASADQIFLPYMLGEDGKTTLYQAFEQNMLMIGQGG